jgi:FkbM family methyltransferase
MNFSKLQFIVFVVAITLSIFFFYALFLRHAHEPVKVIKKNPKMNKVTIPQENFSFQQCLIQMKKYPLRGIHNCCGKLWNEEIRFKRTNITIGGIVVDVGGNTGYDSERFLKMYKPSKMYIIEPIPKFVEDLKKKFGTEKAVQIYQFGIGIEDCTAKMTLDGWSSKISKKGIEVPIKSIKTVGKMLELDKEISLLNINCEGCEWDLLEGCIEMGWIQNIKVIQIGTHNRDGRAETIPRFCRIREYLSKSHQMDIESKPWAWERWIRKF